MEIEISEPVRVGITSARWIQPHCLHSEVHSNKYPKSLSLLYSSLLLPESRLPGYS